MATIPTIPTISPTAPMAIQLQTNGIQSSSQAHNLIQIPQGGNQIVVQQVMSPNGEISQIPVSLCKNTSFQRVFILNIVKITLF